MEHAFNEEMVAQEGEADNEPGQESRIVFKLKSEVAPIQVAVLPLITKSELITPAKEIIARIRDRGLLVAYDDSGTIGRRYRRNDEIGTPYSITIDYDSLDDKAVTIRDRDSMDQVRAPIDGIENVIYSLVYESKEFKTAGTLVQ